MLCVIGILYPLQTVNLNVLNAQGRSDLFLLINIIGSFILGAIIEVMALSWFPSLEIRAFIIVGVLGSFTTFSTFSFDIVALLAMGDIVSGEKIFKKCAACHSIVRGGKNKIGPALYNVVGRKVGGVVDYKYSKALAAYDKEWNFEELNGFLTKPSKWVKGTKMAYAGLRKEKDRASVIKYLNQNSDNPIPLP